jgi:hypothetical protein
MKSDADIEEGTAQRRTCGSKEQNTGADQKMSEGQAKSLRVLSRRNRQLYGKGEPAS